MKRTAAICLALLGLAACGSKQQTTQVVETPRVLTKTATAERAVVQLTEEYTSEILPYKENDITPAASACTSTASASTWATAYSRVRCS